MAEHMQPNLDEFANSLQSLQTEFLGWQASMDRASRRMHQLEILIKGELENCKDDIRFAKQQMNEIQSRAKEVKYRQAITLTLAPTELATTEQAGLEEPRSDAGTLPADANVASEKVANEKCKGYIELEIELVQIRKFLEDKEIFSLCRNNDIWSNYNNVEKFLVNADSESKENEELFKIVLNVDKHLSYLVSLLESLDDYLHSWNKSQLRKDRNDDFLALTKQRLALYGSLHWYTDSRFKQIPVTLNIKAGSQSCPKELPGSEDKWYDTDSNLNDKDSGKDDDIILSELRPGYMKLNPDGKTYRMQKKVLLKIVKRHIGR